MSIQAEISKIALGTVQFGMNYGISNTSGMPALQDVQLILLTARQSGITTLDTAYGYGESEKVLGQTGIDDWSVVSKFPKDVKPNSLAHYVTESLG
ncbi:MAG TPA: aldo/keto reductase, partial [Chitinophagales bacterium]|nr:aldo/keto reductase [Chitinophagales bacterium]